MMNAHETKVVECDECQATDFRFLYTTGDARGCDLVICCECGADAPPGLPLRQIVEDDERAAKVSAPMLDTMDEWQQAWSMWTD